MKVKKIIKKLALFIMCVMLLCQNPVNAYAYTKEEVEAAKAWLAGHGYSPDAAGAAQAYQDYLNGKFSPVPPQAGNSGQSTDDSTGGGAQNHVESDRLKEEKDEQEQAVAGSENTSQEERKKTPEASTADADVADTKEADEDDGSVTNSMNSVSGQNIDEKVTKEVEGVLATLVEEGPVEAVENELERPEDAYHQGEETQKPDRSREILLVVGIALAGLALAGGLFWLKSNGNRAKK